MFRFNNPDALLVLLLVVATAFALRAVEEDRFRWYALCGVAVGFAFLTKQLQAVLVVPGFALALLIAGQGGWWRRVRGLLVAGVALLVSAGWWVVLGGAVAQVIPPVHRRLHQQQLPATDLRLQRLRPHHRQRELGPRPKWGWRSAGRVQRWARHQSDVRRGGRRADRLAAPGRARVAGGGSVAHPPSPSNRYAASVDHRVGNLASVHRTHLQLHERRLPRVLHRRVGSCDRRAPRHRRLHALASTRALGRPWRARQSSRPDRPGGRSPCSTAPPRGSPGSVRRSPSWGPPPRSGSRSSPWPRRADGPSHKHAPEGSPRSDWSPCSSGLSPGRWRRSPPRTRGRSLRPGPAVVGASLGPGGLGGTGWTPGGWSGPRA